MNFRAKKDIGMALKTIRASRSRSLLTMLGVIISVAAITLIVSIGGGIKASVVQQTNQYSKNVITIRPTPVGGSSGAFSALGNGAGLAALTNKDVATIEKVPHISDVVPLTIVGSTAKGDSSFNGVVYAIDSDLPEVLNQELALGAFFSDNDASGNLAVLGATAADKMFDQRVPLGRSFTIHGQQFIVNGILSKFSATPFTGDANFNNAIFVPDSATKDLAPNGASKYEVLAKVDKTGDISKADAAITDALAKNHGNRSDLGVYTPTELANESTSAFSLLTYLTLAAAIITLLVSGVGIMNVMLVSVTERIHEIGIRKAVGATNRQIRNQFLTEAATLCIVGSVIGVILSFITCLLLRVFSSLTPQFDWKVAGLTCLLATFFGVLFGTLPAMKAARKDPIAALRNE